MVIGILSGKTQLGAKPETEVINFCKRHAIRERINITYVGLSSNSTASCGSRGTSRRCILFVADRRLSVCPDLVNEMPRYFFNTRNGQAHSDHEGTDLADIAAARVAALRYAGEILMDDGEAFWRTSEWHLDVSDESGSVLFSLDVSASGAGSR